jgi:hypothetical protein
MIAGKPLYFDAVDDTLVEVNTGPCYVTLGWVFNSGMFTGFMQMFDARAADVTLGTTAPNFVVPVSPGDNDSISNSGPLHFKTAVTIACTDTATGSAARACSVSIAIA